MATTPWDRGGPLAQHCAERQHLLLRPAAWPWAMAYGGHGVAYGSCMAMGVMAWRMYDSCTYQMYYEY